MAGEGVAIGTAQRVEVRVAPQRVVERGRSMKDSLLFHAEKEIDEEVGLLYLCEVELARP